MKHTFRTVGIAALAAGLGLALSACNRSEAPEPETPAAEAPPVETAAVAVSQLALYRMDCGTIEISDIDVFSTAGDFAGQSDTFTDTCWLIRHPKGDLMWDLGLPGILTSQGPMTQDIFTVSLEKTLTAQLRDLGLEPTDVEFISISHSHFDHTGQVDQFGHATWIVHEAEYDLMLPDPAAPGPNMLWAGLTATKFTGEYDVFGDGSVRILEAPGHTPGHSVLLVDLPETGPVMLIGDLWHRKESRELGRVPRFNWDVETPPEGVAPESLTRASFAKVEQVAAETGARIIIQHEPDSVADLPLSPEPIR